MISQLLPSSTLRKGSLVRDVVLGGALALAYWLAVLLGLRWAVLPGAGTPVWPAAGVAFAGLVLGGSRLWPAIVVGRVAAAVTLGTPLPFWSDLLVGAATMLGAYLPARALERTGRPLQTTLGSMRDMLWLCVGGGFAGAVISATLGVGALWLGGTPYENLGYAWINWWFGYFVGVLTVGPLILSWSARDAFGLSVWQWFHLSGSMLLVAVFSAFVFLLAENVLLRTWHILPALVWAALAFNVRGVSVALTVTSGFAIAGAVLGTGPLATSGEEPTTRVLLTQQFIAMNGLTLLFLAAIADERRDTEALGRLAAIVSSSPEAMLSVDRHGRIQSWNRGAQDLFGWTVEEAVGRDYDLILPPEMRNRKASLRKAMAGESVREETERMARDGATVAVLVTKAPVRAPDGSIIGVASVIRDIRARKAAEAALQKLNESLEARVVQRTQDLAEANQRLKTQIEAREQAEAQLRQSQKMEAVGQLTGGIAHDFNNLLTVVIGSLDMARRRATSLEPRVAALIDHALEGANRAARLTTRLLAFSRRQPLSPEPTNVNRLVSGMSELLGRTLGEQNRIETVLAADIWATMVDPNQLENALVNLAVNARDAMPGGGRLTIETANIQLDDADAESETGIEPGEYVLLSVTDTGTGMSRDVLDKVFDPFFTTKEVGKGTGLGLSMVYGFVKQSRGHVRIHSEPGHGTGIKLFLPRWFGAAGAAAPAGREAGRAVLPVILGQANVLVVEDDPDVRVLSVRMLTDLGHHVREAASPTQALEVLKGEERIDLLFTDIVMPDLDGRRLADLALTLRPDLKVLFTTGYTRDVLVEADLGEPFVSLLPKPFTLQQLASKLQEILL